MELKEGIKTRRSIRKFKKDPIDHAILEDIIFTASYAPSWKNTQITRYIAIEDSDLIETIAANYTNEFNANTIRQVPVLMAITYIKERCGYERDGSFSTPKEDCWQMFDAGVATQTFSLAAHEAGLGTVILGLFDEEKITELLDIPAEQTLMCLVAIGYPDIAPEAPKRKPVETLLTYK
ncbi:MAG: nitroreductase family protein [Eubacteriales bacterium]